MVPQMRVLLLAAEFAPLAKVGGLGDVVGELPYALKSLGVEIRVYLPFHRHIDRSQLDLGEGDKVKVFNRSSEETATIYPLNFEGLDLTLVDGNPIASVEGIYSDPPSDGYKFTFFSLAALRSASAQGWKPDILHAQDWHTSPAVIWLKQNRDRDPFWQRTASLLTVHNLPYMGAGAEDALEHYGLDPILDHRLPEWAQRQPLPMGLATADWINAVSPSYADEIHTPDFGHGLEGLITGRSDRVTGILNGIDLTRWNPNIDQALSVHFDRDTLVERSKGELWLRDRLGFSTDKRVPLIAIISRLDYQKGIDLALKALANLKGEPWQAVILGTGDPELEGMAIDFAEGHSKRARSIIRFDAQLARQIYAGADIILIPSRYEPCGLTQMIAMRYGCVPIVAATGGLRDTVTDYRGDSRGTGFVFVLGDEINFLTTLKDAIAVFQDKRRWRGIQRRGMAMDFSWTRSAKKYFQLYERAQLTRTDELGIPSLG
jgi:starch synthase